MNVQFNWWLMAPLLALLAWGAWHFLIFISAGRAAREPRISGKIRAAMPSHEAFRKALLIHSMSWIGFAGLLLLMPYGGATIFIAGIIAILTVDNLVIRPLVRKIAAETAERLTSQSP